MATMNRVKPAPAPADAPNAVGFESEIHMTDKLRHRKAPAPHGFLPNWALVVLVAFAMLVVGLARSVVV
jgi:hypothetical protein